MCVRCRTYWVESSDVVRLNCRASPCSTRTRSRCIAPELSVMRRSMCVLSSAVQHRVCLCVVIFHQLFFTRTPTLRSGALLYDVGVGT